VEAIQIKGPSALTVWPPQFSVGLPATAAQGRSDQRLALSQLDHYPLSSATTCQAIGAIRATIPRVARPPSCQSPIRASEPSEPSRHLDFSRFSRCPSAGLAEKDTDVLIEIGKIRPVLQPFQSPLGGLSSGGPRPGRCLCLPTRRRRDGRSRWPRCSQRRQERTYSLGHRA